VIDATCQTLFLTEIFRGMSLTMKYFWEPKFTVRRTSSPPNMRKRGKSSNAAAGAYVRGRIFDSYWDQSET